MSVRQVVRLRVVKKSRVLSLRAIELCFFICQIFYLSKGLTSVFTQPSELCVTESESKNFVQVPGDLTSIEFFWTRFVDLVKFHETKLVFFGHFL